MNKSEKVLSALKNKPGKNPDEKKDMKLSAIAEKLTAKKHAMHDKGESKAHEKSESKEEEDEEKEGEEEDHDGEGGCGKKKRK